jgi:4-alpha-glucanotransferase
MLGANNVDAAQPMSLEGSENWTLNIELPDDTTKFEYSYIVKNTDGTIKREWGAPHNFSRGNGVASVVIVDRWQDMPVNKPYYASAFTDCINNRENRDAEVVPNRDTVTLRVWAPMIKKDEVVAVLGESTLLGEWKPERAVALSDHDFPEWSLTIDRRALPVNSQFKFVVMRKSSGKILAWESCENRRMPVAPQADVATCIAGLRFENPLAPWRGAGVAIPVFAIRSEDDFGVGDFYDLKLMIDWAVATGQTFLQILPINDTTMTHTWTDSYPYNANSTFALHPMYLRLSELGTLKDKARQKYFDDLAQELNLLSEIDYERVNQGKIQFYKEIFAQEGAKVLKSDEFKAFLTRNEYWLKPYAAFCVLRDQFGTPDFSEWGEYAVYNKDAIARFAAEHKDNINYVYYLQYNLDKQMRNVRDYAHAKGVAIKGDIPIGISRTSVDAWTDTRLFYMDCQAGAPPDDFSVLGQNWGFPTYNWEEMNKDGFAWWKARFRKMSEYFDAYRIDHVLGFFRIWQIPMTAVHGLLGYFNPALPYSADEMRNNYDFWINHDVHTSPYIMDYFLADFFGEYTDEVREKYLEPIGHGRYRICEALNTQRKVVDYFATQEKNEKNKQIADGLLGLLDEVLFIEDPEQRGKYHPRISAQFTYIYRSLNDYERWCYDRLYTDFFYHRHNDFWYGKAMWKLPPLIDATNMLVCAEDLGMIPDCVPAVMNNQKIIALERMPKDPQCEFGNTWTYPYLSVCTTSTHDMGGIRQWWEEDHAVTQRFFNNMLHEGGDAPYFCEPWICNRIVDLHLKSPSMLCILPLQDYLSMDGNLRRNDPREEQINVPANSRHYWRYRMHLTVEQLLGACRFNDQLHEMIVNSGR